MTANDGETQEWQKCAHCGRAIPAMPRYPRAICDVCCALLTDASGRRVAFVNEDAFGGLTGFYVGTEPPEPYLLHECFIGAAVFHAQEGRFGGVVVQADLP
ncbi:hypothetical protein AB870_06895 [Pandoraea faecigallinarum]|uniref:Uncharacterized protein n=1 Tax=Pandoraea faecigallinarum TaxID=656179 RepID=A0A0H3WTN4_9BURK|nr:hypothetical protein [Pandoraea faecigallinarum]AKM29896.1 hypothetical protein AB870_06895 [Pandoraea faecigallinarum]